MSAKMHPEEVDEKSLYSPGMRLTFSAGDAAFEVLCTEAGLEHKGKTYACSRDFALAHFEEGSCLVKHAGRVIIVVSLT